MTDIVIRSATVFIATLLFAIPAALIADEAFKKHLTPESYASWHELFKDYRSIFTTLTLFALTTVGVYWVWVSSSRAIHHEAKACTDRDFGRSYDAKACAQLEDSASSTTN